MAENTTRAEPDASHLSTGDEGRTEYFKIQDGDRVQRMAKFNIGYPKWMIPRGRRSSQLRQLGSETYCGWVIAYADIIEGLVLDVVLHAAWQWDEPVPQEESPRRGLPADRTRCDLLVHDIAKTLMAKWGMKDCEVFVRITPLANQRHYFESFSKGSISREVSNAQ